MRYLMARPALEIATQPATVQNYARLGATDVEMADMVGCSPRTLLRRFRAEITKGRAERRLKLRQLQWKAAEGGNVTMQIWLGKNELGQRDKLDIEHEDKSAGGVMRVPTPVSAEEWSTVAAAQQAELLKKRAG